MMIEEFEQRTGYFPSSAEYKAIEAAYMEFDGDKDEFCKAYKKNANGIAERIRREVNSSAQTGNDRKAVQGPGQKRPGAGYPLRAGEEMDCRRQERQEPRVLQGTR